MRHEAYLLDVVGGRRGGIVARGLRGILALLAYAYVAGLKLYLMPYRTGLRRQARLDIPVISVGNITVGGTGKTPMTARICRILTERRLNVCILSRGYRGAHEQGAAVVSTAQRVELGPKEAGDEAYELARALPGVPVLVGRDRRVTGRMACGLFGPDVVILDDGMQFYQLHRDLEIALVDALRPFDNGWTFPRGLLREPPSHLSRADCIVITNADRAAQADVVRLQEQVRALAPRSRVLVARNSAGRLRALDGSVDHVPAWLAGRRVATLCALGNPASFETQVESLGARVVHKTRFPDHHAATIGELQGAVALACGAGAEAVVVSQKDAVKLPPLGRPLPFYTLEVTMEIEDESSFVALVLGALGKRSQARCRE